MQSKPLITLDNIAIMLRGRVLLPETTWTIYSQQSWAIIGTNGSGKTSLCRALLGEVPICRGKMNRVPELWPANKIVYVSFESQRKLFRLENKKDASRAYRGVVDEETTVEESIGAAFRQDSLEETLGQPSSDDQQLSKSRLHEIADLLQIKHLLKQGIRTLSNGETRKFLILRALMKNPRLLILDEPFDGMDTASRDAFKQHIDQLISPHLQVILITHRIEEIPSKCSHVLCLKDGKVFSQGPKEILTKEHVEMLYGVDSNLPQNMGIAEETKDSKGQRSPSTKSLIRMVNVMVQYGNKNVLDHLNWSMNEGENWAIVGPNGAGKSTLIRLVSGNHLQAYANEIYLFGKRRGTGESIWDIKKRIGLVSAESQVGYESQISVFKVVLSGFFDSIGLFQRSTVEQRDLAQQWIERLSIADKKDRPFDQLSQGEQRLVLLARAMVKSPQLLIADEPCQGLDYANRAKIIKMINLIGQQSSTNVIYITHHLEDELTCLTHTLHFTPNEQGGYSTEVTVSA